MVHFLHSTFKYYGYDKVTDFATCQVADSISSNIKTAKLLGIPHLDCSNHTLNLEVKNMMKSDIGLSKMCDQIHDLMVSIKGSLKKCALLRAVTHLHTKIKNVTR